jgi:hypothetical protein
VAEIGKVRDYFGVNPGRQHMFRQEECIPETPPRHRQLRLCGHAFGHPIDFEAPMWPRRESRLLQRRDGSSVEVICREYAPGKFSTGIYQTWEDGADYRGDSRVKSRADLNQLLKLDMAVARAKLYPQQRGKGGWQPTEKITPHDFPDRNRMATAIVQKNLRIAAYEFPGLIAPIN